MEASLSESTKNESGTSKSETTQRPLSLATFIFLKNGFSEAEALKRIRDLGSNLDQLTHRTQYGSVIKHDLSPSLTKDLVEAKLIAYDSRKDLSTMERVLLKHLYSVLISPENFNIPSKSCNPLDTMKSLI